MRRNNRVDLVVGSPWMVVKDKQARDVTLLGQPDRVLDRRVAKAPGLLEFLCCVLAVVDQKIHAADERSRRIVNLAEPRRSFAERLWSVVGEIGKRVLAVGD